MRRIRYPSVACARCSANHASCSLSLATHEEDEPDPSVVRLLFADSSPPSRTTHPGTPVVSEQTALIAIIVRKPSGRGQSGVQVSKCPLGDVQPLPLYVAHPHDTIVAEKVGLLKSVPPQAALPTQIPQRHRRESSTRF